MLNGTTPFFTLLVAHASTADERLTPNKVAGIVFGFAGVVVLVGAETSAQSTSALLPVIACLGAAFSYGLASVFGRRFRRLGMDPVVGAFGQTTATSLMLIPLVLAFALPWREPLPGATVWAALFGLALLSMALAYVLFFRLLATAGATNTSLVTLLVPVSATLLGGLFLGEGLTLPQTAGLVLIATGLLAIDGRILHGRSVAA